MTTTTTATLTEFVLARVAEDEAVARAATSGGWRVSDAHGVCVSRGDEMVTDLSPERTAWAGARADAEHIARHDPARVLAECAAKRVAVDWYLNDDSVVMASTIRAMAAVYADHPDYDEAWRP